MPVAVCGRFWFNGDKRGRPGNRLCELGPYRSSTVSESSAIGAPRQWFVVQRWQQYRAESRANLLRLIAIAGFYIIHLLDYHRVGIGMLQLGGEAGSDRPFHIQVTLLAIAWTLIALALLICLRRQIFPTWLPYASTAADLILLSAILWVADGPRSPLIAAYFLLIALAGLRFSLPLVRFATLGAMAGYLCLLAVARWPQTFGRGDVDIRVPRYEQLMILLAFALAGIITGQIVRRTRQLAEEFHRGLAEEEAG